MTRTTTFASLFTPLPIGSQTAPNRILHAPMSVCYGDENGYVTRPQVEHYARRSRGGAGIVITENFAVNAAGRQMPKQTLISDERQLPGLSELAGEIKSGGALAMVQLVHAGRYAGPWDVYRDARRLSPSALPFELMAGRVETPQEITANEITESIQAFGQAARLCERAGFDGVDVHGAQGFLISGFLSPTMNQRTDEWGGSFTNRARFALEVVREVRQQTSPDFVVGFHLLSDELVTDGWSIKDAVRLAPLLAAEGVQFLFGIPATFESLRHPPNVGLFGRRKYSVADNAALKQVVDIPVVASGKLGDPADAAGVLERGEADAIGLARALFVDPDWPRKVAEGDLDAIRTCPCDPPTCARTQLSGAICHNWPSDVVADGYLGYQA